MIEPEQTTKRRYPHVISRISPLHHLQEGEEVAPGQWSGVTARHIKENNPTAEEIDAWQQKSGLELKKFFNTSGMIYRDLGLKDKLPGMSRQEQLELLASDGMLVKRPILVTEETVLVGFKEAQWEKLLQK